MKTKSHQLAEIMAAVCHEVLWQTYAHSLNGIHFSTRTGGGKATYCKFHASGRQIQITFGRKMIESKFIPHEACRWLSFREITNREYYQSDTSLLNVFSHTICHEFAHALQQLNRQVYKGSIHNDYFYKHLDHIHKSGLAESVKSRLQEKCIMAGIALDYQAAVAATGLNPAIDIDPNIAINSLIQFKHKNKLITGRVIKVNRKTFTVETKSLFLTQLWRIPKQLASLV